MKMNAGIWIGIIGGIEPTQFLNLSLAQLAPYVEQVIADGPEFPLDLLFTAKVRGKGGIFPQVFRWKSRPGFQVGFQIDQ